MLLAGGLSLENSLEKSLGLGKAPEAPQKPGVLNGYLGTAFDQCARKQSFGVGEFPLPDQPLRFIDDGRGAFEFGKPGGY